MCHHFIKHEKSFRCLRLPVLVEELPEIVIPFGYKNVSKFLLRYWEQYPRYH